MSSLRVVHLPTLVGGNAWGLSRGERTLGLKSDVLSIGQPPFGYQADITITPACWPYPFGRIGRLVDLGKHFLKIRNKYDIFHFNHGASLVHDPRHSWSRLLDLGWYPDRAKLFVTYNGCDARQKYPTMDRRSFAACHEKECYDGVCNSGMLDQQRKKNIAKMFEHVQHGFALNPDLCHFLPKEKSSFLPYTVAASAHLEPSFSDYTKKGSLKIVHAPSQRAAKGTKYLLKAIENIEKKKPGAIFLQLVEGVSQEKALQLYRQADLVVDQLLIGWYGAFAVEAMLLGKPVIACLHTSDFSVIPSGMYQDLLQSVIHADPFCLEKVLLGCIEDRGFLQRRAEAGREYAAKWHAPCYVAGLVRDKYQ